MARSTQAEVAQYKQDDDNRADKPDQSIHDGQSLPALDVFKQDQHAQKLLVQLGESTLGPAELLFGSELTGVMLPMATHTLQGLSPTGKAAACSAGGASLDSRSHCNQARAMAPSWDANWS